MRTRARKDGWMRKTPPRRRRKAQGGIPTKPHAPYRRMDRADQGGRVARVARVASGAQPRTADRPCQPRAASPPQAEQPSRKAPEREAAAPEGNLPIVEKCAEAKRREDSAKPNPKGAQASACDTQTPTVLSAQGARLGRCGAHADRQHTAKALHTLWRQGKGTQAMVQHSSKATRKET